MYGTKEELSKQLNSEILSFTSPRGPGIKFAFQDATIDYQLDKIMDDEISMIFYMQCAETDDTNVSPDTLDVRVKTLYVRIQNEEALARLHEKMTSLKRV